jgi:hypothetical protein
MRALLCCTALALSACGQTGQTLVAYPAVAHGVDAVPFTTEDGFTVTLTRADVGLGPFYFCATAAASSDLCPSAVEEIAASATIDALSSSAQPLGDVTGASGSIRSVTYDLGISWFTSSRAPRATSGAPDGHSARFAGTAVRDAVSFAFTADLDVTPTIQGQRAVQGQRASVDVVDDDTALAIALDPGAWISRVSFEEIAPADGASDVVIDPASRAASALIGALIAQAPPSFSWTVVENPASGESP